MATRFWDADSPVQSNPDRERRFFLSMAWLIAATVVAGFGGYIVVGISHFSSPWWVHVHAVTYMGWIVLYLLQNVLVVRGDLGRHRQVGQLMAFWALWMIIVGTVTLLFNAGTGRTPPIFTPAFMIAMDEINVLLFAALVIAGLTLRSKADWHRRLMFSATVCIIAPALGRLSVLSVGFSLFAIMMVQLAMLGIVMVRDARVLGRPHPALFWGAAAIVFMGLTVTPAAKLPLFTGMASYAESNWK